MAGVAECQMAGVAEGKVEVAVEGQTEGATEMKGRTVKGSEMGRR